MRGEVAAVSVAMAGDAGGAGGGFVAADAEEEDGFAAFADLLANEARLARPPTSLFPSASSEVGK